MWTGRFPMSSQLKVRLDVMIAGDGVSRKGYKTAPWRPGERINHLERFNILLTTRQLKAIDYEDTTTYSGSGQVLLFQY